MTKQLAMMLFEQFEEERVGGAPLFAVRLDALTDPKADGYRAWRVRLTPGVVKAGVGNAVENHWFRAHEILELFTKYSNQSVNELCNVRIENSGLELT